MATTPHPRHRAESALPDIDYHEAEGLAARPKRDEGEGAPRVDDGRHRPRRPRRRARHRCWPSSRSPRAAPASTTTVVSARPPLRPPAAATPAKAPTLADAKGIAFEKFAKVDPTLPAVPAGAVKKFTVDVLQHVDAGRPRPRADRGVDLRGQRQGLPRHRRVAADRRQPGRQGRRSRSSTAARRRWTSTWPHSIDFHSAEVAPNKYYVDVAPGKKLTINFVAKHPGVFMYHCATQPVLMHTGAGMMGMMVVKPQQPRAGRQGAVDDPGGVLPRQARQAGRHGQDGRREARRDRVQRLRQPVQGQPDHRPPAASGSACTSSTPARASGAPSTSSARSSTRPHVEGVVGHDAQTVNLAPSQGGWVEFTLDQEGNYPFVTHAFGDMVKGAAGILHTTGAPKVAAPAPAAATGRRPRMRRDEGRRQRRRSARCGSRPTRPRSRPARSPSRSRTPAPRCTGWRSSPAPAKAHGRDARRVARSSPRARSSPAAQTATWSRADLKPGSYELVCFMPGHYAAGQKLAFEVK